MKHTSNLNANNANTITHIDEVKYLTMLCNEKSDLVIKTEFGIGHYKFLKFTELGFPNSIFSSSSDLFNH